MMIGLLTVVLTASAQLRFNFGNDSPLRKLMEAEAAIRSAYVDTVDESKLVEDAIRGMLEKLDPHSAYSTAKETKALTEPLNGSFEGIGVQFNIVQDTLLVMQTVNNGPSERIGIRAGDRIVAVNDTAIAGVKMSREDIMRRLRGPKGSKVRLQIVRRGVRDKIVFVVTRDKIPVNTVDAVYMIRPQVGYIRVGSFGATTYKEFMDGVDSLRKHGMRDLIIDLQENGGGYLMAAVQMANEFLPANDLIVYTQGRTAGRREYKAMGNGRLQKGKVVVLVNEYSASAAEIVTGAIQDQDRGKVVGRRSFGKGLVQTPIDFRDGSMMRLTVAHYYTPSGRCIQKPYVKGQIEDYAMDIEQRLKRGELTNRDSIHFSDSLKYYTLKQHRVVYGGGGIMPDVFVPLDTTRFTRYHRMLVARNIVLDNLLAYVDTHRQELHRSYPSFDLFEKKYVVPASLVAKIFADGEKEKVKPTDEKERKATEEYMRLQLKALVARDVWTLNEYFRIWNEGNDVVQKALQVMAEP